MYITHSLDRLPRGVGYERSQVGITDVSCGVYCKLQRLLWRRKKAHVTVVTETPVFGSDRRELSLPCSYPRERVQITVPTLVSPSP
jgi:hypothetical protein